MIIPDIFGVIKGIIRSYKSDMKIGTVKILQICVAKTPAEANCESPPNLLVKIGVVEAEGMADWRTITARERGERKPQKPVTIKIRPGMTISLHNTINKRGF